MLSSGKIPRKFHLIHQSYHHLPTEVKSVTYVSTLLTLNFIFCHAQSVGDYVSPTLGFTSSLKEM